MVSPSPLHPNRRYTLRPLGSFLLLALGVILPTTQLLRVGNFPESTLRSLALVLSLLTVSGWIGWSAWQHWYYPTCLERTEALWASNHPIQEILAEVSATSLARGETGYRLRLLASRALWAEGHREEARRESCEAHRVRLPVWKRLLVRGCFRIVPRLATLKQRIAFRLLRSDSVESELEGWGVLLEALPACQDDPILLEATMFAALDRFQRAQSPSMHLGHQEWSPVVPYLFEESLGLLLRRHGEGRIGWDRCRPAFHLLG